MILCSDCSIEDICWPLVTSCRLKCLSEFMRFYMNSIFRMVWYVMVPKIFEVKTHFRMTYSASTQAHFSANTAKARGYIQVEIEYGELSLHLLHKPDNRRFDPQNPQ